MLLRQLLDMLNVHCQSSCRMLRFKIESKGPFKNLLNHQIVRFFPFLFLFIFSCVCQGNQIKSTTIVPEVYLSLWFEFSSGYNLPPFLYTTSPSPASLIHPRHPSSGHLSRGENSMCNICCYYYSIIKLILVVTLYSILHSTAIFSPSLTSTNKSILKHYFCYLVFAAIP